MANLLLLLSLVLAVIALVIAVRNCWVFNRRMELNRFVDQHHLITDYISYDEMMLKFWVWDVEKLRKP